MWNGGQLDKLSPELAIGGAATLSGAALPSIAKAKSDCRDYRFSAVDQDSNYTGVKAKWHDTASGETYYELVGEKGRIRRLRPTHPSQSEAIAAAQAEWSRIQRGKNGMSLTLVRGKPEILTETPVTLAGWGKPEIDAGNWLVSQLRITLFDGLTTVCELETKK